MNVLVPFTKDIKFKNNIAEVLSISLEHDYTINTEEILGNFTITGDYKSHEVSVNKEHFEYVLPFSVSLTSDIDLDSVEFLINDFTYDIINQDTLRVDIEYRVNAKEIEPLFRVVEEPDFDKILDENINTESEVAKETKEESNLIPEDNREISEENKNIILENISSDEEKVNYVIHEMKENDTLESVCSKYNVTLNYLSEYNDVSSLVLGDKLIIPLEDE